MKTLLCAAKSPNMAKAKYIKKVRAAGGGWRYIYDGGGRKQAMHSEYAGSAHELHGDAHGKSQHAKKYPSVDSHTEAAEAHEHAAANMSNMAMEHSESAERNEKRFNLKDKEPHEATNIREGVQQHHDTATMYEEMNTDHNSEADRHRKSAKKIREHWRKVGQEQASKTSKAVLLVTMTKARYLRKVPDGKGGWSYAYNEKMGKQENLTTASQHAARATRVAHTTGKTEDHETAAKHHEASAKLYKEHGHESGHKTHADAAKIHRKKLKAA